LIRMVGLHSALRAGRGYTRPCRATLATYTPACMRSTTSLDKPLLALQAILACGVLAIGLAPAGCGTGPANRSDGTPGRQGDIVASVINVTPYEVSVVLSGILEDSVDTVQRTVATLDSIDLGFACVEELVVGDPLDPTAPGVVVEVEDQLVEFEPFALILDTAFACGDIVEIIVSGKNAEDITVDVFALTP
jgi:hypothetical protein